MRFPALSLGALLSCFLSPAIAQNVSSRPFAPSCNAYKIDDTPVLSLKQRFCLWNDRSLTSKETIVGSLLAAGYSQFTEKSSDRQKGLAGYGERFGIEYAQSTSKGLGEVLGGYLNHEGMRRELGPWKAPVGSSKFHRFLHATAAPFWNYEDDDAHSQIRAKRFAFSRVAGAFASGFVGMLWEPDRLNTPGRALRRSASGFGGYFVSSFAVEYRDDLLKRLKIF